MKLYHKQRVNIPIKLFLHRGGGGGCEMAVFWAYLWVIKNILLKII